VDHVDLLHFGGKQMNSGFCVDLRVLVNNPRVTITPLEDHRSQPELATRFQTLTCNFKVDSAWKIMAKWGEIFLALLGAYLIFTSI